jgi:hypothetical protein
LKAATKEEEIISALGISMAESVAPLEDVPDSGEHVVVPDPHADDVDLSDLRGMKAPKGLEDNSELNQQNLYFSAIFTYVRTTLKLPTRSNQTMMN